RLAVASVCRRSGELASDVAVLDGNGGRFWWLRRVACNHSGQADTGLGRQRGQAVPPGCEPQRADRRHLAVGVPHVQRTAVCAEPPGGGRPTGATVTDLDVRFLSVPKLFHCGSDRELSDHDEGG